MFAGNRGGVADFDAGGRGNVDREAREGERHMPSGKRVPVLGRSKGPRRQVRRAGPLAKALDVETDVNADLVDSEDFRDAVPVLIHDHRDDIARLEGRALTLGRRAAK